MSCLLYHLLTYCGKKNFFIVTLLSFLALFYKLVQDLLKTLPQMFTKTLETQSALGPALQAAFKLMSPTGGRMSVFQTQLPTLGVGALKPREEPNQRSSAKVRKSSCMIRFMLVFCPMFTTPWHLVINVCKWNKTYTEGIKHPLIREVLASTETTARGNNLKLYTRCKRA